MSDTVCTTSLTPVFALKGGQFCLWEWGMTERLHNSLMWRQLYYRYNNRSKSNIDFHHFWGSWMPAYEVRPISAKRWMCKSPLLSVISKFNSNQEKSLMISIIKHQSSSAIFERVWIIMLLCQLLLLKRKFAILFLFTNLAWLVTLLIHPR